MLPFFEDVTRETSIMTNAPCDCAIFMIHENDAELPRDIGPEMFYDNIRIVKQSEII